MSAEDRCEFSDLLKDQCGHCQDRERKTEASSTWRVKGKHHRDPRGPWFEAAFDGGCDGCGEQIEAGDRIRSDGEGGWLCSDCGSQ
jgi:hypothetical protein